MVRRAAVHQHVVGALGPLPAPVAVHRPVASDDRADPHRWRAVELGQVAGAGVRQGVAAVGEGVHHEILDLQRPRHRDQGPQVIQRGVHAAVGHQPQQMHPGGRHQPGAARERLAQDSVLGQRAVRDRVVDAHEVLAHDRAGAKVQMPDLGVAHLPLGQSHRSPARRERGMRVALPEPVEDRRARERHGIARSRLRQPPTVEHHQACTRDGQAGGCRGSAHRAAIVAISAKESACSDAPPTSAPSTSSSASSSAAFSTFTDPP